MVVVEIMPNFAARMKRTASILSYFALTVVSALLVGCIADEVGGIFLVTTEVDDMSSAESQGVEVFFQAAGDWRAWTSDGWLEVSPKEGQGGRNAVVVRSVLPNRTRQRRSAQLILESDGKQQRIAVWQRHEYALFEQKEYAVGAEGGTVSMYFTTNISKDSLLLSYYPSPWIKFEDDSTTTRTADWKGRVKTLEVAPNPTRSVRSTSYILVIRVDDRYLPLDTAWVHQQANPDIIEEPIDSISTP